MKEEVPLLEIGGYFELELPKQKRGFLHSEGILLNSGRHALQYILECQARKPQKVFLPYYTCDSVFQPLQQLGIPFEFYHIGPQLEISSLPEVKDNEYIIINNYFGIKDRYVSELAGHYGPRAIIDQSQAWYADVLKGVKAFYSPRKFFGIPDGGVAYGVSKDLYDSLLPDYSWERFNHLLKRHELAASEGYSDFKSVSSLLKSEPLKRMSPLTRKLLSAIDMEEVKEKRVENFNILHDALHSLNKMEIKNEGSYECPLVYPFLVNDPELRNKLLKNRIYVATYWPNVLEMCKENTTEYQLAKFLLPLPIDQRYGASEMKKIIEIILN